MSSWRVVYQSDRRSVAADLNTMERRSIPMSPAQALDYLEIFADAQYIEKIVPGRTIGFNRIYRKDVAIVRRNARVRGWTIAILVLAFMLVAFLACIGAL